MALAAAAGGRADLQLVRPFIQATLETIKVKYSVEISNQDPFLRGQGNELPRDFAAVFSVFSRGANVAVCLGFQKDVYKGLIQKVMAESAGAEVEDGLRDLVNAIFSKVRGIANTDGRVLNRGVPAIVHAEGLKVSYLSASTPIIVPFETAVGPFQLEVILET